MPHLLGMLHTCAACCHASPGSLTNAAISVTWIEQHLGADAELRVVAVVQAQHLRDGDLAGAELFHRVQAVLLDHRLQEMDGFSIAPSLDELHADVDLRTGKGHQSVLDATGYNVARTGMTKQCMLSTQAVKVLRSLRTTG